MVTIPPDRSQILTLLLMQMVEGGWYFCPTDDSDDQVCCAYCKLSLDGWEPKDKPLWVIPFYYLD